MKKTLFSLLLVALLSTMVVGVAFANDEYVDSVIKDGHKIRNKWDLSGTFVAHPGYNWGGIAEGATWTYKFHIKEAMDGRVSKGTIHFYTMVNGTEIDVVGQVMGTKRDYAYWSGENLAAVGTAEYNGQTYYFMFLYAERAAWLALSTTPYTSYWDSGGVWGGGLRAYQLHSKVPDETFLLDYKVIHTEPE